MKKTTAARQLSFTHFAMIDNTVLSIIVVKVIAFSDDYLLVHYVAWLRSKLRYLGNAIAVGISSVLFQLIPVCNAEQR